MGDGHYVTVFSVSDSGSNTSSLYYRILTHRQIGLMEGKFLADRWNHLMSGLHLEEPGRILLSDYNDYRFAFEITHGGSSKYLSDLLILMVIIGLIFLIQRAYKTMM